MEKNEIGFINYLTVFFKWKKAIIINSFIVCLLAAVISLILPKWYTARTTIMPPSTDNSDLGVSALLNSIPLAGISLGAAGVSEGTNIFIAIINSRTILESVAEEFNLQEVYKTKNMEETIKALRDHYSVEINQEGTITISAEAKTKFFSFGEKDNEAKELSKNMANFFIKQLDNINQKLKVEKARNTRIFIEKRYVQNLEDIKNAEEEYKAFQEKYGAISLPDQTAALITTTAELKAQIIAKEVEVSVLKNFVSSTHPELAKIQIELNELNSKYSELCEGTDRNQNTTGKAGNIFLPIADMPMIGLQYMRLFRELTIQVKLLEFLLPQYEQAKIKELQDTPTVQVLDSAIKPERKSSPKRMVIVLIAGLLSVLLFAIGVYIAVKLEYIRMTDNKKYQDIQNIFSELKLGRLIKS